MQWRGAKLLSERAECWPRCELFGPVEAGFLFEALLVVAEQAADHVPAVGAADLDIPLPVDANNRVIAHAGRIEIARVQLVLGDQALEGQASHLDKLHASCSRKLATFGWAAV